MADEKKRLAEERKANALRLKQEKEDAIKKAAEERKAKAAAAAEAKKAAVADKKAAEDAAAKAAEAKAAAIEAAAARRERQEAALQAISNAVSRATVSLFGLGGASSSRDVIEDSLPPARKAASTKKAPLGVPTIGRWRQNSDGSITGLVRGSRNFADGDKITTSAIASGKIESGQVVRTGSGSRYFLD